MPSNIRIDYLGIIQLQRMMSEVEDMSYMIVNGAVGCNSVVNSWDLTITHRHAILGCVYKVLRNAK